MTKSLILSLFLLSIGFSACDRETIDAQSPCRATAFSVEIDSIIEAQCNQSSGAINYSVNGGTPPYEYSLNDGDIVDELILENLSAGDYRITVYDQNECSTIVSATVPDNCNLTP